MFKNKKKKKIIKGYKSYKRAFDKFKSISKQPEIWFDVKYENAEKCKFEIALLSNKEPYQIPLFQEDELGRNEEVFISSETDYTIREIKPYKIEEKIYDWQKDKKPSNYPNNYKGERGLNLYSDGTLAIYNSADNPNFKVEFENLFPYSLSPLQFDSQVTDVQYLTATVNFKYTIYNIEDVVCC